MSIATRLNQQWREIAETQLRWADEGREFTTATEALTRCQNEDSVVAALVRRAQDGEQICGLIVLYATLPRLKMLARRDRQHNLDDYVANFWFRLMTFPEARLHKNILVNLALDTMKQLKRQCRRPLEVPGNEDLPRPDATDTRAEVIDMISASKSLGLVSSKTAEIIKTIYVDGYSGKEAAQIYNISHAAVRNRCSNATKKLRMHAQELLAAA